MGQIVQLGQCQIKIVYITRLLIEGSSFTFKHGANQRGGKEQLCTIWTFSPTKSLGKMEGFVHTFYITKLSVIIADSVQTVKFS